MSTSCSKTALQKCYRCKVAGHDIKGKVDRELRKTKHVKDQEAGWDVFICIYCISSGSCFCTPFKKLRKCPHCQSSGNSGTEVGTLLLFEWSRGLWMRCHEG
jgi:hypothetical protein